MQSEACEVPGGVSNPRPRQTNYCQFPSKAFLKTTIVGTVLRYWLLIKSEIGNGAFGVIRLLILIGNRKSELGK